MPITDVTTAYQIQSNTTVNRGTGSPPERAATETRPAQRDEFVRQAQTQADAVEAARSQETERRTARAERRDEFVQSTAITRNAVYNVTDVISGGLRALQSDLSSGQYGASGERINRKIIDILLPLGRKSLSIYSTEP